MVTSSTPMPSAGDEAPQIDAQRRAARRHHQRRNRIPQQREGEDGAAAVAVGDVAEAERGDEQSGEGDGGERRLIGQAEKPLAAALEHARADQAGADIGGHQQVVQLETAADRQQHHQLPDGPRRRQAIQPRGDRRGGVDGRPVAAIGGAHAACRARLSTRSSVGRVRAMPRPRPPRSVSTAIVIQPR